MAKKITQNVNKDKFFNDLPKVHPEFSKWMTRSSNYQSCNLGDIVPIYYDEVLPGEKRKITMGMISHTTTPIAPIFNSLYTEIRAFFVPHRLSADLFNGFKDRKSPWVKVFGESYENLPADGDSIIVPLRDQSLPAFNGDFIDDLASYLGSLTKADNVFDSLDIPETGFSSQNLLNLAAYELIYQRHYRNENYEAATESDLYKMLYNAYNDYTIIPSGTFTFEKAPREKDYFTGAKPFTLKASEPIKLGFAENANIVGASSIHSVGSSGIQFGTSSQTNGDKLYSDGNDVLNLVSVGNDQLTKTNLVADLKNASGISIEELRILVKTQELLEKDAMYGTRYAESLNAHFGTCPLDLTLQDPQELYRTTITSNMQAIFQTSSTSGETSILGTIGANSTTQTDPFVILPETEFKEHGLLMICAVHKMQNVYDSRYFIPKFNTKKSRFDFYTPELNDLGFQPVTNKEVIGGSSIFGYNEAFAEYRYKFNKRHGSLNSSFPYWAPALENDYSTNAAMYKEQTSVLDDALSVKAATAPQFYDAWGFEEVNTKPMSLHSIPGMDGVI